MKYEVLITTEVVSRIVIESNTDIAQLLPGPERSRFIESLEDAASNYNAQNTARAVREWRGGRFAERSCFQGVTYDGNPDLNLEEWNEGDQDTAG